MLTYIYIHFNSKEEIFKGFGHTCQHCFNDFFSVMYRKRKKIKSLPKKRKKKDNNEWLSALSDYIKWILYFGENGF